MRYVMNNAVPVKEEGITQKELYLDVMEKSIEAYDLDDIRSRIRSPIFDFQNIVA